MVTDLAFVAVHSIMNKVTGVLFVLPLTLTIVSLKYSGIPICSVATFAAAREGHFIAPYKTLVVEYYDEEAPAHDKCEIIGHEGNVARYRFAKSDITAADIIADLSAKKSLKDVSIEEAGIDDIIKIAYGN